MKPIARQGDLHRCPCSGHGVTPIVSGSPQSRIEGQPVARVGDKTSCGATIIEGSGSATTDGQPTAYHDAVVRSRPDDSWIKDPLEAR